MHSFTTERLLIRPLAEKDERFYCQQYTDEKVMRNTGGALAMPEATKVFFRSLRANQYAIGGGKQSVMTWAITCKSCNNIIGAQTLSFLIRPYNESVMENTDANKITQAEIGIMLAPKANGRLIPEEAMGALMEYGFNKLKLERIHAFYASKNLATKRFVNKLGFIKPVNLQDGSSTTSYQYFDCHQWHQKLIKKVIINSASKEINSPAD
jgi:ribosomal-protein-alanine N-acetyltransferase